MPQKLLLGLLKTDIAPRCPKEAFKTFVKASENGVNLASINLFKINNEIRRIRCEICSKLKILALRCSYRCFYKRCSENIQQIYKRMPMPKCDFNKVAKQLY